ncbi:MAG: chorismate mutase [Pseudomonadota bacterium]
MADKPPGDGDGTAPVVSGSALDALRDEITTLDSSLIELLARRRELAVRVAQTKASSGRAVRDQEREEDLLVGLIERGRFHGLDAPYVTRVFHLIIDDSVRLQQARLVESNDPAVDAPSIRVAFQGDTGSYSQVAVQQHFASRADRLLFLGFDAFSQAVEAVESGSADYAMLPIENTTSGGINEVYDLLMHTPLSVIGEETLQIDHCLLAAPGATIESLDRIYAHPQGFAQCSKFVSSLRHCRQESLETAEAVRRAAQETDHRAGAIASRQAGERYGLVPLATNIANQRENVTRFLCVARQARSVPLPIACKTSLVMATADTAGSLVEALSLFRDAGLSMCKLESRPIMGNPWEEMFYVDVEANVDAPAMRETLQRLARVTRYLKVLGCYASHQIRATAIAPERWVGGAEAPVAVTEVASAAPESQGAIVPVRIGALTVDDERFAIMASPAHTNSKSAAATEAEHAAQAGASALVSGLQDNALTVDAQRWRRQLQWLAEAARATRLPLIATVMRVEHVAEAAAAADALRLDGRHMEHLDLLRAVGRTARPVVLTRGRGSSIRELLRALNILRTEGNRQVMLCEAGIGAIDDATQTTLDLGAVARLRHETNCPMLIDPGSALGTTASLAMPLLAAGKAVGANGCLIALGAGDATNESETPTLSSEHFAKVVAQVLQR